MLTPLSQIPLSHKMERLSEAYVHTVMAMAGVKLFGGDVTEYGVDGYFQRIRVLPNGELKETGICLQCQIKATTTSFIRDSKVVYDMRVRAYNKLVDVADDDAPTIFILFRIPPEEQIDTWLLLDDDTLVLKHCCYWDYITGSRLEDKDSSHRIEIPIEQRLTPEAVANFFTMLKEGKFGG
ncbi:MAG: DUF4365 domain-containing protein [Anaerolineales bacterium]|nr:DUF4365 domain-containing protein [Anaerolineales bacterium]